MLFRSSSSGGNPSLDTTKPLSIDTSKSQPLSIDTSKPLSIDTSKTGLEPIPEGTHLYYYYDNLPFYENWPPPRQYPPQVRPRMYQLVPPLPARW